jgi:hypothetical protein
MNTRKKTMLSEQETNLRIELGNELLKNGKITPKTIKQSGMIEKLEASTGQKPSVGALYFWLVKQLVKKAKRKYTKRAKKVEKRTYTKRAKVVEIQQQVFRVNPKIGFMAQVDGEGKLEFESEEALSAYLILKKVTMDKVMIYKHEQYAGVNAGLLKG